MNKEIIYAFIDGQNLYESLNRKGVVFSYEKLRGYLRKRFRVARAVIYFGDVHNSTCRKARRAGFIVRKKKGVLQVNRDGTVSRKANIDIDLVVGVLSEYRKKYTKAVIVSGDGDFISLVEDLKKKDQLSKVIAPSRDNCSFEFDGEWAEEFVTFLDDPEEKTELLLQ